MAVKSQPAQATNGNAPDARANALTAIESSQRGVLAAVRKFLAKVDDEIPGHGPSHSRVHGIVDGALEMSQQLVHERSELLRGLARDGRDADQADR